MSDSYTNLIYHLVFSTKDRCPLITDEYQVRLYDYIGGTIRSLGGISLGINGTEDHVHVLAKLRSDKAVSDVLRAVEGKRFRLDARCVSGAERFLVATRLRRIHRQRIECCQGSGLHRAPKRTSPEAGIPR